ncbi:hypothetical protein TWF730_003344 [Orbilia blumenaviensis]|uniref:Uncharacterized protein n=1 Tax=Orbilia blumenaviensis TaxID=1796055 RepID=A0AAV9U5C9_9PEZI
MFPVQWRQRAANERELHSTRSSRCLSLVPVAAGRNGEFLTVITKNAIIGRISHFKHSEKLGEAAAIINSGSRDASSASASASKIPPL